MCVAVIGPCSDFCVSAYHYTFLYDRIWSFSVPTPSEVFVNPTRWSRIFENLIFAHMIKILFNIFETRRFISVFTTICPHSYLCEIYFNIILPFMLNALVSQVVSYIEIFSQKLCMPVLFLSWCNIKNAHRVEKLGDRHTKCLFKYQCEKHPSFAWRIVWVRTLGLTCSKSVVKGMPYKCGGWILRKLELSIHVVQVCVYIQRSPAKIQIPTHKNVKPYRPQHDRPATYVIAQQYSSATFVSFPKRKIWRAFQKCYSNLFFYFNIRQCLKLRNLKLCKSGNVCSGGGGQIRCEHWVEDIFLPPSEWNSVRPVS